MKTHPLLAFICFSMVAPSLFSQTNAPANNQSISSQPSEAAFQQALVEYHQSWGATIPAQIAATEKVIKVATAMDQLPPIPEEARKHFVMGTALFKDAKTDDDYTQVCAEFTQAVTNAPWWPEARYNRGLAYETAGDYAGALLQFKFYQLFKLSADEARTVQDKIYVLEAKQEKAAQATAQKNAEEAKAMADAAAAAARQRQIEEAKRSSFVGTWVDNIGVHKIMISRDALGNYTITEETGTGPYGRSFQDRNIRVNGRNIRFIRDDSVNGFRLDSDLTLSDDGEKLVGGYDFFGTENGPSWKRGDSYRATTRLEFHRQ